ncbi:MAG: hypothetical protein ACK5Y2_11245 [Bdellovibrionales bacterium]
MTPSFDTRILIAGNPNYGLAAAYRRRWPGATFASRSAGGYDLTTFEAQTKLANESLNFDVFISCSCLHNFHQVILVKAVIELWKERGHPGHLIAIGSTADTPVKGESKLYPIEKKALRDYCRNLSFMALGGHGAKPPGFRVTYITPGYVSTPSMNRKFAHVDKLEPDYLAEVTEWVIQQPSSVNISQLSLDPIQISSDQAKPQ